MTEQTEAAGNQGAGSEVTSENRRHIRYRVNLPVHIKLSTGEVARARAVDISTDSVYVEYGAPADEGKIFEMLFDLPFASDFRRVYVKGKVVRAVIIGDRNVYGIAFSFVEFARDTGKVLEKYLELRRLKQTI